MVNQSGRLSCSSSPPISRHCLHLGRTKSTQVACLNEKISCETTSSHSLPKYRSKEFRESRNNAQGFQALFPRDLRRCRSGLARFMSQGLRWPSWRQTLLFLFFSLCLPPLPALLKRSMPHNNGEVFHISLTASQPLFLVCLFIQSPWQHEVEVDIFCISDQQVQFSLCLKLIHLTYRLFSSEIFFFLIKKRSISHPSYYSNILFRHQIFQGVLKPSK